MTQKIQTLLQQYVYSQLEDVHDTFLTDLYPRLTHSEQNFKQRYKDGCISEIDEAIDNYIRVISQTQQLIELEAEKKFPVFIHTILEYRLDDSSNRRIELFSL